MSAGRCHYFELKRRTGRDWSRHRSAGRSLESSISNYARVITRDRDEHLRVAIFGLSFETFVSRVSSNREKRVT